MDKKKHKISPLKQRISQFIDYLGISKREFYNNTKISRGSLENISGASEDTITKLIATYGDINSHWLLTGEGDMLNTKDPPTNNSRIDQKMSVGECEYCLIKDKLINSQQEHINTLVSQLHRCQSMYDDLEKKLNRNLDNGDEGGKKRKVG